MRWFNELRGDGVIQCEDGNSYEVQAADFVVAPPVGRCAGLPVTFTSVVPGRAVEVALNDDDVPRRARARSQRVMRASS